MRLVFIILSLFLCKEALIIIITIIRAKKQVNFHVSNEKKREKRLVLSSDSHVFNYAPKSQNTTHTLHLLFNLVFYLNSKNVKKDLAVN